MVMTVVMTVMTVMTGVGMVVVSGMMKANIH